VRSEGPLPISASGRLGSGFCENAIRERFQLSTHPYPSSENAMVRMLASRFAHPQTLNDLPYFEHLEPPVSHCVSSGKIPQGNAIKKSKTAKPSQHWPHLAANQLALSGRKPGGPIWPQLHWLYVSANSQDSRCVWLILIFFCRPWGSKKELWRSWKKLL
jgi:hypothetical protein